MKRAYVTIAVASIFSCLSLASSAEAQSGACCIPENMFGPGTELGCVIYSSADCTTMLGAGAYQGDGTDCSACSIPEPSGACCHPTNGGCYLTTDSGGLGCTAGPEGYEYQGDGTACQPDPTEFLDGCPSAIPTVSEWGLVVMTLLVLTTGTLLIRRGRRVVV